MLYNKKGIVIKAPEPGANKNLGKEKLQRLMPIYNY